jgi:SAM-dependent methyltransferase
LRHLIGAWLTDAALEIAAQADVKYEAIDIEGRLFPKEPPKNTTYSVASVLELPDKWSDSFSFVHQRLLMGALTSTQWVTAVKELYRVTKPGGWVELSEGSEHLFCPEGRPRPHIQDLAIKVYLARGLKPNLGPELPNLLKDAGFVDITLVKREIPIGKWGGELGELGEFALGGFFRSIKKPVLDKGGLGVVENAQQFDALVESMVKEWNEVPGYNWYHYIAYARKPGGE